MSAESQPPAPWALVTGASSGLGVALARDLAARGYNLALTARRPAPMEVLAAELIANFGVRVVVEPLDLTTPGAPAELQGRLEARGVEPDVLVNNAGFGLHGRFVDNAPDDLRNMIQLDVVAITELTHLFGRAMLHRGGGRILLVASVAAFQPTPLYAAYGAAKAYVLSLGGALDVELGPTVSVAVLSPGLMDTEFLAVAGHKPSAMMRRNMVTPETAARTGLDALFDRRPGVITGLANKITVFATRLMSRRLQAKLILWVQS